MLEGEYEYAKIGLAMGATIGRNDEKWQEQSFVSDNVCEATAKTWSAQLNKLGLI